MSRPGAGVARPGRATRDWGVRIGAALVALVVGAALLSFVWTPADPTAIDPTAVLVPPGGEHLLGTDPFGRDVLSQLLVGARITLLVGFVTVIGAGLVGIPLGMLAAFRRGPLGSLVERANDLLLAFPALILAIMLAAGFGPSTMTAAVAIAIGSVPPFVRVARTATAQVLAEPYTQAARLADRRGPAIARQHVLPNIAAVLMVQASLVFAFAVLAEAALSYLGLGTRPPTPTWGRMLQEAQGYLASAPWLAIVPGVAVAMTVLGLTLLGDGLRDRLDPRLRGRL